MNTTIILPDANQPRIAHILAKDNTAVKYINKEQIMAELGVLYSAAEKFNIVSIRSLDTLNVASKSYLLDLYEDIYRKCVKYNTAILSKQAKKSSTKENDGGHKAARLGDAEERFTRYSDELAKREAGDMMGLDAKGQKHRIASLKRKIARAEASLKKLQENS